MGASLRLAGVYNVLWGAWAVLFPQHFWSLVGMEQPNYPFLWQCIGMIVGVYGLGYWIAATDPVRHWPIVLVGLLGKVLGPIGFVDAHFVRDLVPLRFGLTLLTNDLLWWVPFTLILRHAYREHERVRKRTLMARAAEPEAPGRFRAPTAATAMMATLARTPAAAEGLTLMELSRRSPVLVVFLRHLGCTFCREALADLRTQRPALERAGVAICLVHMVDDAQAGAMFARYGLGDVARVSDPDKALYRAFDLARGSLTQLFGPRLWLRGVGAGLLRGHLLGPLAGDGLQMPGAFLVHHGLVVRAFRHQDAADRPDYCELAGA
jgi:peroxiredoxin